LRAAGLVVASYHAELNPDQKDRCIDDFNLNTNVSVLILTYRIGGVGINLQYLCWHSFHLTRAASKAIEEQAAGRIRRIGQLFEQIVIKFMLKGAWDEDRYEKFKNKALSNFYAMAEETEFVKWDLNGEDEEGSRSVKRRRVIETLRQHNMNDSGKRSIVQLNGNAISTLYWTTDGPSFFNIQL
jgi:SNF2 family DNA or RNA helicase